MTSTRTRNQARRTFNHGPSFWIVAVVFLLVMAYSTVPTPLYPLYQLKYGFPSSVVTVIFAAYAVGVIVSLYLFGHVSDWLGRRRILVLAVLVSALSAVLFLMWASIAGLIVARLINGVSIGILTATATAHLTELRGVARPREGIVFASSVSGTANIGGLALGPLIGGLFAAYLPAPLMLPHLVFLVVLLVSAATLLFVPETAEPPTERLRYRPQRLSVPRASRRPFAVAAFAAFAAFAVFGLFTSLAPTFLVVTFHTANHLVAGLTSFSVFAAAAAGQIVFARNRQRTQLTLAVISCAVGLSSVAAGALLPVLAVFILGGIISGLGVGLLFKASIGAVISLADPARKGETLALIFLIAYTGLALPVLAVGGALTVFAPVTVLVVFLALALVASLSAGMIMRRRDESSVASR